MDGVGRGNGTLCCVGWDVTMEKKMTGYQQGLLEQAEKLGNEVRALISLAGNKPWLVVDRKKTELAGQYIETGLLWLKEAIENPSFAEEEADWRFGNED